jgi:L-rhamnose-H+ transport protein
LVLRLATACGGVIGEWKGVSKKAKNTIIAGIAVIVLSIMLVGYGNSLK